MVGRDDGGAAAEPAETLAEWDMKIDRKVALRPVVGLDPCIQLHPVDRIAEFCGWRITGISRACDIIFFHQLEIDMQRAHGKWNQKGEITAW